MILSDSTEMVERQQASSMAEVYRRSTARLVELMTEVKEIQERLKVTFGAMDRSFRFHLDFHGCRMEIDEIVQLYKIAAWQRLIEHTGIRRVMSIKRQSQLDKVLGSSNPKDAEQLPEISEETIISVLGAYASSVEEMLEESVREVYDWLRPRDVSRRDRELKTNQRNFAKLTNRVVLHYVCSESWQGLFNIDCGDRKWLMVLDNIFHMLDGRGAIQGHQGPLLDAIAVAEGGKGETEYFRFKCCKNRNFHLQFLREDLLDRFNAISAKNYLPPS